MTTEEFGAFLYDLLSEAARVVEAVWVNDTPDGPVLVVGLKTGELFNVRVTPPADARP